MALFDVGNKRVIAVLLLIAAFNLPLTLLLAGYETFRYRRADPLAARRDREGDYDLILVFMFVLLVISLLLRKLPISW